MFECTNFDKLLIVFKDGTYSVINIPEKQYVHHEGNKVVYVGVADKKTILNAAYRDPKTHLCFAKRFIVTQFILDKTYRFFEEGMDLQYISSAPQPMLELQLIPKIHQKQSKVIFDFNSVAIKGFAAKGIRIDKRSSQKGSAIEIRIES